MKADLSSFEEIGNVIKAIKSHKTVEIGILFSDIKLRCRSAALFLKKTRNREDSTMTGRLIVHSFVEYNSYPQFFLIIIFSFPIFHETVQPSRYQHIQYFGTAQR